MWAEFEIEGTSYRISINPLHVSAVFPTADSNLGVLTRRPNSTTIVMNNRDQFTVAGEYEDVRKQLKI